MDIMNINKLNVLMTDNFFYVVLAFGVIFLIMLIVIISLQVNQSRLEKNYKKMMGDSTSTSLEKMLTDHAENMQNVISAVKQMDDEISAVKNLLARAITRVAIVRYDAFEDIGSDLSFSIALLDSENSGVIISAINGRDSACTYAKPVERGVSTKYKLSKEEEQVLREASGLRSSV